MTISKMKVKLVEKTTPLDLEDKHIEEIWALSMMPRLERLKCRENNMSVGSNQTQHLI